MSSQNNTGNRNVIPEAKNALDNMKTEIANELGLANYNTMDKGNLTARQNGYVGGDMVKKMIEQQEKMMAEKNQG